jgi:hypothetical protein
MSSEKANALAAKLLAGSSTSKPSNTSSIAISSSFKDKAPALIEKYKVSWETVVRDLKPQVQCLIANNPDLADLLSSWEGKTKEKMQDVLNNHIDKYCN